MINAVTDKRIRAYILDRANSRADKVRITKNGEVHFRALGKWFFEGFTENIAAEIEQIDRDRGPAAIVEQMFDY